jgi:hypothetical protein
MARLQLRELCGYRSGDKADIANVAVFADDDESYEVIVREVTAERVKAHFGSMVRGRVDRYEARNVLALNFVLHEALGGGGPRSLRSDSLGKTRLAREPPPPPARRQLGRPHPRRAATNLSAHRVGGDYAHGPHAIRVGEQDRRRGGPGGRCRGARGNARP